jgi:hypothetical protein
MPYERPPETSLYGPVKRYLETLGFGSKLEEMAKKWLDAAAELEEVEASLERHKISEKKAG